MTIGWGMIVWAVVFWGGLIALIVWAVRKLTERSSSTTKSDPMDIAKERYAKGEISRAEFEQIKNDLS